MTWDEHLDRCKKRALEYVDAGDLENAVASMASDIQKHDETKMRQPLLAMLTFVAFQHVTNHDVRGVRDWINGFH